MGLSQAFPSVDRLIKRERLVSFLLSAGNYGWSDRCGDWCNLLFCPEVTAQIFLLNL
jgi:hypothetical protein